MSERVKSECLNTDVCMCVRHNSQFSATRVFFFFLYLGVGWGVGGLKVLGQRVSYTLQIVKSTEAMSLWF